MAAEKPADEQPGEKRRASARLREPAAKRHAANVSSASASAATATATAADKPTAVPAPNKKVVPVREKTLPPKTATLPTKVVEGKPLPTSGDFLGIEVPESELQSVSERCAEPTPHSPSFR
jgi:hypothetical protein